MTDLDKQLTETWGPGAQHSEYRRGEIIRYRVNDATHTGTIIWVAAPRESQVQGHGVVPTHYIVVRQGWSGFPDVVYSSDILTS